ncbi:MAG: enterochelin esterase [Candidatus Competibacteraceae bacterium]|nr:enterochelin esterase [Candidatus Competibacteraceae bacterium]
MALKRPHWPQGRLLELEYTSKILADNPLNDPSTRKLAVWLPPHYDQATGSEPGRRFPVLYDLAGFTGSGLSHIAWRGFDENLPERLARLLHEGRMGPVIMVLPDCFTALGGNQYINSPAIGSYADYLTRELIPFIDREFRTLPAREHRGCFGKSSGGYGAMLHGMKYARYWGAIANHSGDAYFDFVYYADWPNVLTELAKYRDNKRTPGPVDVLACEHAAGQDTAQGLDDGRVARFLAKIWQQDKISGHEMHCLMALAMAASYDPDPAAPNGFRLPFNLETGELIPARWKQWQKHDPINLVGRYKDNLASLKGIFIDCGWRDQYNIHYGARILSKRLQQHGVEHVYEEFDDNHSGIDYRQERSLPFLYRALQP